MTNTLGKYQTCEFFADKCKLVELLNMRVSQAVAKANSRGQNLKVSTFWHIPVIWSYRTIVWAYFTSFCLNAQKFQFLYAKRYLGLLLQVSLFCQHAARALDVKNIEVNTSK